MGQIDEQSGDLGASPLATALSPAAPVEPASGLAADALQSTSAGCNCIAEMDAQLAEYNTRIQVTFAFPRDGSPSYTRPLLGTEKVAPRVRRGPALAIPTFCPFCGVRYQSGQS